MKMNKGSVVRVMKIKIKSEIAYILAIFLIAFAVAMISATNYGVSMVVAPAYILSLAIPKLTFGMAEYVVQGLLFIVLCIITKRVRIVYFSSFVTGLIYGAFLDLIRLVVPHFNPEITPPGSLPLWLNLMYFVVGTLLTAISVAIFFKIYLYSQVYDFFVKTVSCYFSLPQGRCKLVFDFSCLAISVIMTLAFFGGFYGIGIGTVITAFINSPLIMFFSKLLDRYFEFPPIFSKFAAKFEISPSRSVDAISE